MVHYVVNPSPIWVRIKSNWKMKKSFYVVSGRYCQGKKSSKEPKRNPKKPFKHSLSFNNSTIFQKFKHTEEVIRVCAKFIPLVWGGVWPLEFQVCEKSRVWLLYFWYEVRWAGQQTIYILGQKVHTVILQYWNIEKRALSNFAFQHC